MLFFEGVPFWIIFTVVAILVGIIGFLRPQGLKLMSMAASAVFIACIYGKEPVSLISLLLFVVYEYLVIRVYGSVRSKQMHDGKQEAKHLIQVFVAAGLLPLVVSRLLPFAGNGWGWGFLGISYITFRVLQILLETHDGLTEPPGVVDYLNFMLFFPTLSSGPIDRSRRFIEDADTLKSRETYAELFGSGIVMILQGVIYKVIISQLIYDQMSKLSGRYQPQLLIAYMYLYGFYLFFDFAGYSLMAVGAGKLFGITSPMNFDKPFLAKDIKDFWNRWHISLSHWFRDFIFTRIVVSMLKKKRFKKRLTTAMAAYIINMFIMGVWHGLTWCYVIYGLYHGILLSATEYFQKKSKFYKKHKAEKWFIVLSTIVTFHLVMVGFFIFSEKPAEVVRVLMEKWR